MALSVAVDQQQQPECRDASINTLAIMEENQNPLLEEQQDPKNPNNTPETVETPSDEATATTEPAPTEDETDTTVTDEAEAQPEEVETDNATEEHKGKTPEELKNMSDAELLALLEETVVLGTGLGVRQAVDGIRAEVDARFPRTTAPTEAEPAAATQPDGEGQPSADDKADEEAVAPTETEEATTPEEEAMRSLLAKYDERMEAERREARKKMEQNAEAKSKLLEQLEQVVAATQTSNPSKLLGTVKDIIAKWKEIGHIPTSRKSLNKSFHSLTEEFFGKLNIDRELRELDMRRNMDAKIKLCEQAEALTTVSTTRKAYSQMQKLRDSWKAIGPVPRAESDALWERFKAAGKIITQNFRKSNEELREQEKENYKVKQGICDEIEALLNTEMTRKDLENLVKKAQDFTARWKSVGFAPKDVNDEIYRRFRKSLDKLYDMRRAYVKEQNERFDANLRLKEALCEKAEAVMNSTDWRQTSNFLIGLQKEWKEVGPVSNRHSEAVWRRFRKACDTFFDNKQSQHEGELSAQGDNLVKKRALLDELKAYAAPTDEAQHLADLKDFVLRWNAIGLVPSADRNSVNKEFAAQIDKQYSALNIDRADAEMEQYRGKVEAMAAEGGDRLRRERIKMQALVRQAEQDVETLENNIGFFAKSKNSDKIISEFNTKIANARTELEKLNKRMGIINEVSSKY